MSKWAFPQIGPEKRLSESGILSRLRLNSGTIVLRLGEYSLEDNQKPLVRGCVIILLLVFGPVVLYIPIHDRLIYMPDGGLADLLKVYPLVSLLCAVVLLLRWLMKALG